ncbi:NADH-quinone oxidoreductase subunit L [Oscillatoria laete-virens NRMC-F 0139]|nr:NADH-quinone oxidoreductase subunit L [Oscillatoria laete-virens]MDL5054723.1 NADH-quinone oxidoreductase subunit L [Oscillatoria laete-virens NRMC-F 0139]
METWTVILALMLAAPFAAALAGLCAGHRRIFQMNLAATISVGVSLAASVGLLGILLWGVSPTQRLLTAQFAWMDFGLSSSLPMSFVVDPLSAVMAFTVSFVALMVFIFSGGYMGHDERKGRYFCFLSFFTGSMLGMVVSNSLLTFLIFWEMMGLASYLLIGFWFRKPSAAAAARKAFLVTRIGDLGLLAAVFFLHNQTGTLLFLDGGRGLLEPAQIALLSQAGVWVGAGYLFWIGLLALWGAAGKSGQVPLHVWLPDAMEGPTPVSALIHAATMVAAGVFLMCRLYPLYESVAGLLTVITWLGAVTALLAALIAIAQSDIKRILAYSTVSQLGLMLVGLGTGGPAVAMFHLFTHAFFKSLLFLGSGSVIHACDGQQDIWRMGGLRGKLPKTFTTYVIGAAALAGVPLLAGFWSKDEILYTAFGHAKGAFVLVALTSALTAFYMTRQVILIFFGRFRGSREEAGHLHESPPVLTGPLIALAAPAAVIGLIGTPWLNLFGHFLGGGATHAVHMGGHLLMMLGGSALAGIGIFTGYALYLKRTVNSPEADPLRHLPLGLFGFLQNRCYIDEFYAATVGRWMDGLSRVADIFEIALEFLNRLVGGVIQAFAWAQNKAFDDWTINGAFAAICQSARLKGVLAGKWQNGDLSFYLRMLSLGALLAGILYWVVTP